MTVTVAVPHRVAQTLAVGRGPVPLRLPPPLLRDDDGDGDGDSDSVTSSVRSGPVRSGP